VPQQSYLEINGKRVKVSNLQKVLYPATGFTKADVIDYYTRISPVLLSHLKDRPISLKRYPDGVDGFFFYEKSTKAFAHALAEHLESKNPDLVISKMQKKLRSGKVFVDWSQNDEQKTTICVYSLRAKEHPTVSTPISWKEVGDARKKGDIGLLTFEADEVLRRVKKKGDLFASVLSLKQRLPSYQRTSMNTSERQ
jgi:DNA primase